MASQGKATDQIINGIGAMLDSLPFRLCSTKAAKAQTGTLLENDQGTAEFRQGELMCIAAGYSLPGQKLFKQLT
jgi:hypothetical protein